MFSLRLHDSLVGEIFNALLEKKTDSTSFFFKKERSHLRPQHFNGKLLFWIFLSMVTQMHYSE